MIEGVFICPTGNGRCHAKESSVLKVRYLLNPVVTGLNFPVHTCPCVRFQIHFDNALPFRDAVGVQPLRLE
jgi:hypothetical protein